MLPYALRASRLPNAAGSEAASVNIRHRFFVFMLGMMPLLTISAAIPASGSVFSVFADDPPLGFVVLPWFALSLHRRRTEVGQQGRTMPRELSFLLFLWLGVALLSLIRDPASLRFVAARFLFVGLVAMAYSTLQEEKERAYFQRLYLVALFVISLLTFLHAYGVITIPLGDQIRGRQLFSFLPNRTLGIRMSYGELGIMLSLGFAFIFSRLFGKEMRGNNWRYWLAFLMLFLLLLVSQSRASFLGFAMMCFAFGTLAIAARVLGKVGKLFIIMVGVSTLIATFVFDLTSFLARIYYADTYTAGGRLLEYRFALRLLDEHPWFGVGYGAFNSLYVGRRGAEALHNSFLHEFVSVGWLGGSVYVLIFAWAIFSLMKVIANPALESSTRLSAVSLISALASTITILNFFPGFYVEALAVMLALTAHHKQLSDRVSWSHDSVVKQSTSKPASMLEWHAANNRKKQNY